MFIQNIRLFALLLLFSLFLSPIQAADAPGPDKSVPPEAVEQPVVDLIGPLPATDVVSATGQDMAREASIPKLVDQQAQAIVNAASKAVVNVVTGVASVLGEDTAIGQFFIGSLKDSQEYMQSVYVFISRFWWLIMPIFFLSAGLFFGYLFEKILLTRLKSFTRTTRWQMDDIFVDELGNTLQYLFMIAGTYGFLLSVPMRQSLYELSIKVLQVLTILLLTLYVKRSVAGIFSLYSKQARQIFSSSSIFNNVAIIGVYAFGGLIVLRTLEIDITPILTALGVGGLAVALALQSTLSNMFSGIQIILSRQLKPGDYIRLATGEEGYVVDITWRNTMVRQLPNNMHIIPNSKLGDSSVINFYQPEREMSVTLDLGVSYDSDLKQVEKITIAVVREVMNEVPGGIPDFDPIVRFNKFADFSINFTVVLRAREFVDQYLIKHEFIKRLHERYRQEGIVIPYPVRTIRHDSQDSLPDIYDSPIVPPANL